MADIIEVTRLDDPALDIYVRLTEAQLRSRIEPEKGLFIAESPKVIGYALDAGIEPVSFLAERRHVFGKAAALISRCPEVPVYTADSNILERLTGYPLTRGILCAMRRPVRREPEAICAGARRIAVLENIVDATNVGALFRSAAGLGMDALLLTPGCCDPLNRRAVRVSMGTVFQIPWARIGASSEDWPEKGLRQLKALGFKTCAMALSESAVPVDDQTLAAEDRLAVVLGTEGDGLAGRTIAECDCSVVIPMFHGVDSLNVAAAGAVAFWALRPGRGSGPSPQ